VIEICEPCAELKRELHVEVAGHDVLPHDEPLPVPTDRRQDGSVEYAAGIRC
jgi:hypothetical protein